MHNYTHTAVVPSVLIQLLTKKCNCFHPGGTFFPSTSIINIDSKLNAWKKHFYHNMQACFKWLNFHQVCLNLCPPTTHCYHHCHFNLIGRKQTKKSARNSAIDGGHYFSIDHSVPLCVDKRGNSSCKIVHERTMTSGGSPTNEYRQGKHVKFNATLEPGRNQACPQRLATASEVTDRLDDKWPRRKRVAKIFKKDTERGRRVGADNVVPIEGRVNGKERARSSPCTLGTRYIRSNTLKKWFYLCVRYRWTSLHRCTTT